MAERSTGAEDSYKRANALLDARRFNEALALDPRHVGSWINKGYAPWGMKRHEEAVACYDRALEIDPNLAHAWFNNGDELGYLNRFIEAKACFEIALDLGVWQAKGIIMRCEYVLENECYG